MILLYDFFLTQGNNTFFIMQVLELRLKLIIEWIINKKQSIYDLIVNHLSIFRAIKQFIQAYLVHMDNFVQIIEKNMKQLSKNTRDGDSIKTVIQLLDLVRQKELINIEQWRQKLKILENRYQNANKEQSRPFPDIFNGIDTNIEYYSSLRQKLKIARLKIEMKGFRTTNYQEINQNNLKQKQKYLTPRYQREPAKDTDRQRDRLRQRQAFRQKQLQRLRGQNVFKRYGQIVGKYDTNLRKTDMYANLYDKQYGENNKNIQNVKKIVENPKQKYKQKQVFDNVEYSSTRTPSYSPYKLVNPKYSPIKEDEGYFSQKQRPLSNRLKSEPNYLNSDDRAQKYKQYKNSLYEQLYLTQQRPKYTADKYIHDTPIKKFNKNLEYDQDPIEYTTPYSERYGHSNFAKNRDLPTNLNKGQYRSDRKVQNYENQKTNNEEQYQKKTNIGSKKKYQYLFDDDSNPNLKGLYLQDPPSKKQEKAKFYKPKDPFQNLKLPTQKKSYKYHYENYLKSQIHDHKTNNMKPLVNNDSLDEIDPLGSELQVDMPVLFTDNTEKNNLENMLTDSLLSSKKWQNSEMILPQIQDSLDNADLGVRQTGKFIQYTDSDQDNKVPSYKYQNILDPFQKPLTIQKQASSVSQELNMSFGRN